MKNAVIISDNSIIYDAINDNSDCHPILGSDYKISAQDFDHVDLLILDKAISSSELPLYRINLLINFTDKSICKNEILLRKPYKLQDLLNIYIKSMHDNGIFCCINKDWIYNQRNSTLANHEQEILLTDKENTLFAALLKASKFSLSKNDLKSMVWKYHHDSESTTVDTHLYKLKQKLPANLLEIDGAKCSLNISSCSY